MRTPHTSCQQGKRVFIKTKDGREYRGKFYERTSRMVVMYGGLQIPSGSIRVFKIDRKPMASSD